MDAPQAVCVGHRADMVRGDQRPVAEAGEPEGDLVWLEPVLEDERGVVLGGEALATQQHAGRLLTGDRLIGREQEVGAALDKASLIEGADRARRHKAAEHLLRRGFDVETARRATGFMPDD